ncbi:unnamed protein product [Periconia digitata]|uniref:Uncharacterized protein n=1 Tax=Periconia digitata TaxID=1303443 RepID=A0A9W4XNM3_9PLEO|nr:unnamed protein product [Periconia digitata]
MDPRRPPSYHAPPSTTDQTTTLNKRQSPRLLRPLASYLSPHPALSLPPTLHQPARVPCAPPCQGPYRVQLTVHLPHNPAKHRRAAF